MAKDRQSDKRKYKTTYQQQKIHIGPTLCLSWRRRWTDPELCYHPCWVKTSMATISNLIHTALNNGLYFVRCRIHHVWSQCIQRKITCKGEVFLLLQTKSFLHSESDSNKAYAPTLIHVVNLFIILSINDQKYRQHFLADTNWTIFEWLTM